MAIESAQRHKLENPDFEGQIVDMRVGVHSGRVIYAIVGSKRYKFDVYSQGNSNLAINFYEITNVLDI